MLQTLQAKLNDFAPSRCPCYNKPLVLLCHKFCAHRALAATGAPRQGSGDGIGEPDAHGCNRVRDV